MIRCFPAFLLATLLCTCGPAPSEDASATASTVGANKPNVIYILADDLGYGDLGAYGQEKVPTPNIDRLAERGLLFTQHYSGSTVCAPSRSALMTGLHTGHTYVRGNKEVMPEGQPPIPDSIYTLAEMMADRGYRTGAFGKWGLGFPGSEGEPTQQGFNRFYGYNCQRMAHHYYPHHLWDDADKHILEGNEGQQKNTYAPDLIQAQTLDFIEASKDEPFFLYYAHVIPHAELAAPDSLVERFAATLGQETPYEGYDEGPRYRKGPYESAERPHATFAAMVTVLDMHVGQIVGKLEELGIAESTLIIFTSDNGPHVEGGADPDYFDSNGPLKGYKRDLYEGGIRVPMVATWPGTIEAGRRTDHISAFWDIYPTLAELSGGPTDRAMDGISMVATFTGEGEQEAHDYLYWEFHEKGGRQAVRMGNWKGVRYDVFDNANSPLELYDLSEDVGEENDVADDHPEIVAKIDSLIRVSRVESEQYPFEAR